MDHLLVRSKRESYQNGASLPQSNDSGLFLIEWNIENFRKTSPFAIDLDIVVEAKWNGEKLSWRISKTSDDVFRISDKPKASRVLLSSKSDDDFLLLVEDSLKDSSRANPKLVLKLLEASRWTFAKENIYNEPLGPKIKEGDLLKASGGYESYQRSRLRVLISQAIIIAVSITVWSVTGNPFMLSIGFGIISLLSLAHWSYYRLSAIDATCVIPCLFLPPVGPILVIVWGSFQFLFVRGDQRWFVLRPGHLEYYESWDSPRREAVGVLLLDRHTSVRKSAIFSRQFICSTPYRSMKLWTSSRRERDDWVEKITNCVELTSGAYDHDVDGVHTSFAPTRKNIPVKLLIDGRNTFKAMAKALKGAQREIFIAGWMLSPELYLERGYSISGRALPQKETGLFQTKSPTIIIPGESHRYVLTDEPSILTSYWVIVGKAPTHLRPRNIVWSIRGKQVQGDWITLNVQKNINFQSYDALEPIRIDIPKETSVNPVTEIEFTFFDGTTSDAEQQDSDDEGQQRSFPLNSINIHCGGVVLFTGTRHEEDWTRDDERDDDEHPAQPEAVLPHVPSSSLLDRFFQLFSRTDQESRLDSIYSTLMGGDERTIGSSLPRGHSSPVLSSTVAAEHRDGDDDDESDYSYNFTGPISALTQMGELEDLDEVFNSRSISQEAKAKAFTSRLDRILARKSLEGVKIYILVYRDVDMFLPNASFAAKRKLLASSLWNRNIQIIRHAPIGRTYGSIQHFITCSLSRGKTWWSHHEKILCVDQSIAFVGGLDLAFGRYDDDRHLLWDRAASVWTGKDYYNAMLKDFVDLDSDPYTDLLDRTTQPRMPWHDVSCAVGGTAAVDIARHFIGRWNAEKRELKARDDRFNLLIPRYPIEASIPGDIEASFNIGHHPFFRSVPLVYSCQVLRSVAPWSSPSNTEKSILEGYMKLIRESKQFIYIEQQFFSSGIAGKPVRNPIAAAIANRIVKACRENEPFRAIIVLPILPAFEGTVEDNYSARSILHWNLRTIRKMREKICNELGWSMQALDDSRVLGFYSLRKVEPETFATEQIYIHSKIILVDDEHAIIGSANLNDRSLLGTRDSEIAVLINGPAATKKLRMNLWREHLGLNHATLDEYDVLCPEWDRIADYNTSLLEKVFPNIPRNDQCTLNAATSENTYLVDDEESLEIARQSIREGCVRGHLIRFPVNFLSKEKDLLPRVVRGERESVVPFENFT